MLLFPRLSKSDAEVRFETIKELSIDKLIGTDTEISDLATFAATGGHKISDRDLTKIRQSVVKIARRYGFPEKSSDSEKAEFDARCAVWLKAESGVEPGEGFRNGVWAYMAIELLPDVAAWRFPERNKDAFLGGVRNTFQRLWRRAFLLDHAKDPKVLLHYLDKLQADTFVQLVERPGSSANPYVASRIANAWIKASELDDLGPMQKTHRDVMKEVIQIGAVIRIDALAEQKLDAILDRLYLEFGKP